MGDKEDPTRPQARGPDEAVLATFDENRALLFSIAYRMLGSVADAEDVLQRYGPRGPTYLRSSRGCA